MDVIKLRKYHQIKELVNNPGYSSSGEWSDVVNGSGDVVISKSGSFQTWREFIEIFINDQQLSDLLTTFLAYHDSLLKYWVGVLGSFPDKQAELFTLKRLLLEPITDEEIRSALPKDSKEKQIEERFKWHKEHLLNDLILIYCCHECGNFECGGINVKIDQKNDTIIWTFFENELRRTKGKTLQFHFEKSQYSGVFNKYRKAFLKNKDTRK